MDNNFNSNQPSNQEDNVNNQIPEINSIPPLPEQEPIPRPTNNPNPQHGFQQQSNQQQFGQQEQFNSDNQQKLNYTAPVNNINQSNNPIQIKLPNSSGVLTLGILSIVSLCCCGPFLGPILAIIALFLVRKGNRLYNQDPSLYKLSSLKNLKTGQICSIIGLSLGALIVIFFIIILITDSSKVEDINNTYDEAWNEMGY